VQSFFLNFFLISFFLFDFVWESVMIQRMFLFYYFRFVNVGSV
jgi:hypothetical protein